MNSMSLNFVPSASTVAYITLSLSRWNYIVLPSVINTIVLHYVNFKNLDAEKWFGLKMVEIWNVNLPLSFTFISVLIEHVCTK